MLRRCSRWDQAGARKGRSAGPPARTMMCVPRCASRWPPDVQPFETSCAGFAGRDRGCGGGPSEIRRAASVSERAAGDHTTPGAGASAPHDTRQCRLVFSDFASIRLHRDCLRPFFLAERECLCRLRGSCSRLWRCSKPKLSRCECIAKCSNQKKAFIVLFLGRSTPSAGGSYE